MTRLERQASETGDALIEILRYDPSWPLQFERERSLLATALAPWLAGPIEHIGSTAIPGMVAKPVIDIMLAVQSLETSRDPACQYDLRHLPSSI